MTRLSIAAALFGSLVIGTSAQAGWPHGNPHHGGYPYERFDRNCRYEPTVTYFAAPVIYPQPVVIAPQPVCRPPVVYRPYCGPQNNVAFYGRNFGLQFNW